ncbi:MAG: phosphoribosylamine--glycine ligase, partial [Oscillospiraceae bacterium]
MKILVVGSGGREHALIKAIKKSSKADEIFCCPGNGGIAADAECVNITATDLDNMVNFAVEEKIDLVVVAPDDPLAMGMVDRLNEKGIMTFGPSKLAAEIESSKVFSKNLMKEFGIPTAAYEVFDKSHDALEYIKAQNKFPVVIKADGLALGKGVIIAETWSDAVHGVNSIMEDKVFGASGNKIVIEEFMTGPEVSVLAFTDGKVVKPMVSAMDHKRALDGDKGLNTGGMGTIAPNPYYTEAVKQECMDSIFLPTIAAMNKLGRPFKGCLYFGLMLTPNGAKVIEYNCRFGDPETQVVLPLLKTDLVDIMIAIYNEKLSELEIDWSNNHAACVIMASGGYPEKYEKGIVIEGLDEKGQPTDKFVTVYHAGTKITDGKLVTNGGRVLGVSATATTQKQALEKA